MLCRTHSSERTEPCKPRGCSLRTQPGALRPSPAPDRGRRRTSPSLPLDLTSPTSPSGPQHRGHGTAPPAKPTAATAPARRASEVGWGPFRKARLRQTVRPPSQLAQSHTEFGSVVFKKIITTPPKKKIIWLVCRLLQMLLIRYLHPCAQFAF